MTVVGEPGLAYMTDFYTENPATYYPSKELKKASGEWIYQYEMHEHPMQVFVDPPSHSQMGMIVSEPGDPRGKNLWGEDPLGIVVPQYATPLNQTDDPAEWWIWHRPLLVQTASLGPIDINQRFDSSSNEWWPGPSFQGFRYLRVGPDGIRRVHYVRLAELRQRSFQMPFEAEFAPAAPALGGLLLYTRDEAGQLRGGSCWTLTHETGTAVELCDEDGDGDTTITNLPSGGYTVHQAATAPGYTPGSDQQAIVPPGGTAELTFDIRAVAAPASVDLTGTWMASNGGTYYVRQVDGVVWWLGVSGDDDGAFATNVFRGTLDGSGTVIDGEFADVPRGTTEGWGQLVIVAVSPDRLDTRSETGGFGAPSWTRVTYGMERFDSALRATIGNDAEEPDARKAPLARLIPQPVQGDAPVDLTGHWTRHQRGDLLPAAARQYPLVGRSEPGRRRGVRHERVPGSRGGGSDRPAARPPRRTPHRSHRHRRRARGAGPRGLRPGIRRSPPQACDPAGNRRSGGRFDPRGQGPRRGFDRRRCER